MKRLKQEAEKLNFSRHHESFEFNSKTLSRFKVAVTKNGQFFVLKKKRNDQANKFCATFDHVSAKYGTVKNTWQRYLSTGSVRDIHRPGRPKVFSVRSERRIVRKHKENPFLTAIESGDQWAVSRFTVGKILKKYGLQCRKPHKVPVIFQQNKNMRRIFADKTRSWNQQWKQVLWSDESTFCLHQHDGRIKIYRQPKPDMQKRNQLQFDRWKIGGILVWVGISYNCHTNLVFIEGPITAQRYIDEVLVREVVPFLQSYPEVWIFQQDNASPHSAEITNQFLAQNDIRTLPWTPTSPDLSPIEHVWDQLKQFLRKTEPLPRSTTELKDVLNYLWLIYPQSSIRKLIDSMPRRIMLCIRKRGGPTSY